MKSVVLTTLSFIIGLVGSAGWRLTEERFVPSFPPLEGGSSGVVSKSISAPSGASKPAEKKTLFGRNESIEGLARAIAAPKGGTRANDLRQWADRLAATDPFLACEMLLEAKNPDGRDETLRRCLRVAMKIDPFRAFDLLAKSNASGEDAFLKRDIERLMIAREPKKTWDTLAAASGGRLSKADTELIGEEWGQAQGYAAAKFGLAIRDVMQRATFLRKALSAWAGEDAVSFAKWFRQQPGELALGRFVRFESGSSNQPGTLDALDAVVSLDLPVDSSSLGNAFEHAWENNEMREHASEWIARQQDPAVRDAAWDKLAREYLKTDVARAAGLLGNIGDAGVRRELSSTIAAEIAKTDAAGALDFAAALADDAARANAAASALLTWAKHEPAASLAYTRQHVSGIEGEQLWSALSDWGKVDPVATMELLDEVNPAGQENHSMKSVARDWVGRRPDEVDAWLAKAASGRVKDVVSAERSKPAERPRISGSTIYSGPGQETHIQYGAPGKSSTSTTINGRAVKYHY